MAVFLSAAEVVMRLAAGAAGLLSPSVLASGEVERAISFPPLAPAFRNGEGVRPTTGGVAVREIGGVGFLIAGLSQDEKKSSSGSPAGVLEPSPASAPSTTTSLGYLMRDVSEAELIPGRSHSLLGVPRGPLFQLLLVLGCCGGLVLGLGVLAVEGGGSAILLEELGRRLIAAHLHNPELVPLPFCTRIPH